MFCVGLLYHHNRLRKCSVIQMNYTLLRAEYDPCTQGVIACIVDQDGNVTKQTRRIESRAIYFFVVHPVVSDGGAESTLLNQCATTFSVGINHVKDDVLAFGVRCILYSVHSASVAQLDAAHTWLRSRGLWVGLKPDAAYVNTRVEALLGHRVLSSVTNCQAYEQEEWQSCKCQEPLSYPARNYVGYLTYSHDLQALVFTRAEGATCVIVLAGARIVESNDAYEIKVVSEWSDCVPFFLSAHVYVLFTWGSVPPMVQSELHPLHFVAFEELVRSPVCSAFPKFLCEMTPANAYVALSGTGKPFFIPRYSHGTSCVTAVERLVALMSLRQENIAMSLIVSSNELTVLAEELGALCNMSPLSMMRTTFVGAITNAVHCASDDSVLLDEDAAIWCVPRAGDWTNAGKAHGGRIVEDGLNSVWQHVIEMDMVSMYPSIIDSFNVCQSTMIKKSEVHDAADDDDDVLDSTFEEVAFHKTRRGVLSRLAKEWMDVRKHAADMKKKAVKTMLVALCGVLASPYSSNQLQCVAANAAVTAAGRVIMHSIATDLNRYSPPKYVVVGGVTDSIFVTRYPAPVPPTNNGISLETLIDGAREELAAANRLLAFLSTSNVYLSRYPMTLKVERLSLLFMRPPQMTMYAALAYDAVHHTYEVVSKGMSVDKHRDAYGASITHKAIAVHLLALANNNTIDDDKVSDLVHSVKSMKWGDYVRIQKNRETKKQEQALAFPLHEGSGSNATVALSLIQPSGDAALQCHGSSSMQMTCDVLRSIANSARVPVAEYLRLRRRTVQECAAVVPTTKLDMEGLVALHDRTRAFASVETLAKRSRVTAAKKMCRDCTGCDVDARLCCDNKKCSVYADLW